jgi:hypothetical protein
MITMQKGIGFVVLSRLSNTCSLIATLLNLFGLLFISHLEFKHLLDFLICLALGALALVQS